MRLFFLSLLLGLVVSGCGNSGSPEYNTSYLKADSQQLRIQISAEEASLVESEIADLIKGGGYTSLGSTPETNHSFVSYNFNGGVLTLTLSGVPIPDKKTTSTTSVPLHEGTAIPTSGYRGGVVDDKHFVWCVTLTYRGVPAVVTESGYQPAGTLCSPGGISLTGDNE